MTQVLRERGVADRIGVCVRTLERWEWLRTRDRVPAKATPLEAGGSSGPGKDA